VEFHFVAKQVKSLIIPIYGCEVLVSFNAKALSKYLLVNHSVEQEISQANAGMASIYEHDSGHRFYSLFVDRDCFSVGVLAHECVHCAWDILNDRGIAIDPDNHEALTYLVGWLAEEVNKFYSTGK